MEYDVCSVNLWIYQNQLAPELRKLVTCYLDIEHNPGRIFKNFLYIPTINELSKESLCKIKSICLTNVWLYPNN